MDKCFFCNSKESLLYVYPISKYTSADGIGMTLGLKMCKSHRTMMEVEPELFESLLMSKLSTMNSGSVKRSSRKRGGNAVV